LISTLLIPIFSTANAVPQISIITEKEIYSYGDFLSFTIQVSEVTGEIAILHIVDEAGKRSSAIPIEVADFNTMVPSPFPFESTIYPVGKYFLEIQYSGSFDSVEFELIDSGNIVIPLWIKEISNFWVNNMISDSKFVDGIEFLINEDIIVIPNNELHESTGEVRIPSWVKLSTGWWIDGGITDKEYAASLEYLIKMEIILI
jgi:hypothetical protein